MSTELGLNHINTYYQAWRHGKRRPHDTASGNVYVTGASARTTSPDSEYATVKYDSAEQQQWVARYSGPGNLDDEPHAIAVDSSGNVYVTEESVGLNTDYGYATIKYDSYGHEQRVARYNGPGNYHDVATAIAVDCSGNVYVTGSSANIGSSTDLDYGYGQVRTVWHIESDSDCDADSLADTYADGDCHTATDSNPYPNGDPLVRVKRHRPPQRRRREYIRRPGSVQARRGEGRE
jgi:hypothetical protein